MRWIITKARNKNKWGIALAGLVLGSGMAKVARGQVQGALNQGPFNEAPANDTVSNYQDFAKYPPESRPLRASSWDLLHPWSTDTAQLPMLPSQTMRQMESLRALGLSEDEVWSRVALPPSIPRYKFDMNKTIFAGTQDQLQARLTVAPPLGSDTPVRIHVSQAEIIGDDDFGSPHLGSVPFSCETTNPVCTFEWQAPAADQQYWGALELEITLAVEGMDDEFVIGQSFYSSPIVAGQFTGEFQEGLNGGSLVIDAGVNVEKRMACFVSANLFSVDNGTPAQHVERRMIVDPSMKAISFTFFGKIFRDFGDEGTFRLQDLKAQCENLAYPPEWFIDSLAHEAELEEFEKHPPATREPTRIYFEYNTFTYKTRSYPNNVFSDREWQSPDRSRKLQKLREAGTELNDPTLETRKRQMSQSQ